MKKIIIELTDYDREENFETLIEGIDSIISDLNNRNNEMQYYIDCLNDIKEEAKQELEEVQDRLYEDEKEEREEEEREYWGDR